MTAVWSFTVRDTNDAVAPLRYGYMAVVTDLAKTGLDTAFETVLQQALAAIPKGTYREPLNVLHIGLAQGTQNSDSFAMQAQTTLQQRRNQLGSLDIRTVNFFIIKPGAGVQYFNYFAETGFAEDPISRNMRPTMPQLLEINRLAQNHELERMTAVGRNAYLFLGREKLNPGVGKVKGERPQVLFLRAISLSEETIGFSGAARVLNMALEEIERAQLDPKVTDTSSSRVFLNILPDAQMPFEELVTRFQKIMDGKDF
jgi:hypothetical protein